MMEHNTILEYINYLKKRKQEEQNNKHKEELEQEIDYLNFYLESRAYYEF